MAIPTTMAGQPSRPSTSVTRHRQHRLLRRARAVAERNDFEPGDRVILLAGPFIDCTGEVLGADPAGPLVHVLVNIFGREHPTEVDAQDLLKQA